MKKKPLISIVVPVHNEAAGIEWFHGELVDVLEKLKAYAFEILYINDGSTDGSLEKLHLLPAATNVNCTIIDLSRNFGKEAALSAGIASSQGEAVLSLDADGQHPIEYIAAFIEAWAGGAEVVVGVRGKNEKEGFVKRYGSKVFYSAFNKLSGVEIVPKSTDFRLIDRKVANTFNSLRENNRITRGLIDWLGYKRSYIYFDAKARQFGQATYTFSKLVQLAVNTFISLSAVPLFIAGYLGLAFICLSVLAGLFVLIEQVLLGDPMQLAISGTAMLGLLIIFLVGAILSAQGLIGLYIARILSESQGRPLYIIREARSTNTK